MDIHVHMFSVLLWLWLFTWLFVKSSQVYCCLMNKKWHIFAEAEENRNRKKCLFLLGLFSVTHESRTGQESLSECQWGFQCIYLPVCLLFCLFLSFFDKQSSDYILMYGFESVHMKTCTLTLVRGMRASRLLILSIISMVNEQLCCCDWNSSASSCKCSQSDICCSAPSAWGLCCN